ncbi:MAG: GNAT family N-acetyltransferase [Bacteroidia bacterium]|nr:GNAT family N-acetyltransferase [Bacteroidia bacterium]
MKKPGSKLSPIPGGRLSIPDISDILRFRKPARNSLNLKVDEGLFLRALRPSDDERLYVMIESNRWHLEPWLSWIEDIHNLPDTRNFLKTITYRSIYAGGWVFGIEYQGKLVGLMDFNEGNAEEKSIALGYWLDVDSEGQGLITKAVRRCVQYLFDEQDVSKIYIKCATDNLRSEAVPKRLDFNWEGIYYHAGEVKGKAVDLVIYTMEAPNWKG